jgi:16S rRNA C967 or C1407 C5-methylase (RsmB/RsmF family)/NOL1/NOP2/fmu family ribosome biogenesis protein
MSGLSTDFVAHLKKNPYIDFERLLLAHAQEPVISVRQNKHKAKKEWANSAPVNWCSEGVYLPTRPYFAHDPCWHAGVYYVQEASSMYLATAFANLGLASQDLRVLDLCAAPGGKTTLLLDQLSTDSLLVSNEVVKNRLSILQENASKWGRSNHLLASAEAKQWGKLKNAFDVVVVDAPCSGSGLFRKDADAINEWSEAQVGVCADRQENILKDIWPALKPGGYLIYSTCSYSVEENEGMLERLQNNPELEFTVTEHPKRFSPDMIAGEGFFLMTLQKAGTRQPFAVMDYKAKLHLPKELQHFVKKEVLENHTPFEHKENWYLFPARHYLFMQDLKSLVYIAQAGIEIGHADKKGAHPSAALAWNDALAEGLPSIQVDEAQALKYLKREEGWWPESLDKGYYLVKFENWYLGWVKAVQGRLINAYPMEWRLRK